MCPLNIPLGKFPAVLYGRSLLLVYDILKNHKNGLNCSLLLCLKGSVAYYHFLTLWHVVSAGLDY